MDKTAYEAIVAEFGKKICAIGLDNGRIIYVGYDQNDPITGEPNPDWKRGVSLDDITVVTYGSTDFLKVTQKVRNQGNIELERVTLHPIDQIQCIQISNTEGYGLDILTLN